MPGEQPEPPTPLMGRLEEPAGAAEKNRMRNRVLIALALVAAAAVGSAGPARAQCGPALSLGQSLAETDIAFIGRVVDRSNRDRTAVMDVLEVWKGRPMGSSVVVNGGPEDLDQFTAVDRSWLLGHIYLVTPANGRPPFQDSLCSGTRLWTTPTGEIPEELQAAVGNPAPLPLLVGGGPEGPGRGLSGAARNIGVAIGVLGLAVGFVYLFRKVGSRPRRTTRRGSMSAPDADLTAVMGRGRRRMSGFALSGLFGSKPGSRVERIRKTGRRRRRGAGKHEKEQLARAVRPTVTTPPSRRNHYTSGRRSAP